MNLILMGPQGSGKGTQAELLSAEFNIPTVSMGQLLRDEISQKTFFGEKVAKAVTSGALVLNKFTNELIKQELKKQKYNKGIIIDGYPRELAQAKFLTKLIDIDYLVIINISQKETIKRLGGRRVCECGETYHIIYKKPKKDMLCDKCGKKLYRRKDDYPQAIKQRLKIYHNESKLVIDYFKKQNKLIKIKGEAPIKQVFLRLIQALKEKGIK